MGRIHAGNGHAVRLGTKKRQHSPSPTSTWPWSQVPEDATTRLNNPSDMLSSLEEIRTKLEAELCAVKLKEVELCAVKFYMNHLKTTATYVRSPFAQRPVSRCPSSSNVKGKEARTRETVSNRSGKESTDEETVKDSTSSDSDVSAVKSSMTLRPRHARGCRGRASTERSKAKYEAKKAERNQVPSPIISSINVPNRGRNKCGLLFKNETENIDPNGNSKNVFDVNNVANGGENKLFASLFPPTELTKASSKGLSSIGRGEEPAAPDKNRVNSSQIGTPQQEASPLLELSSIGRRKEPEAPDRNRVNSSQGKQHDVLEELHSIGRGDEPTALGQNRVNSSQDSQDTEQDHLEAYGGDAVPQVQESVSAPRLNPNHAQLWQLKQTLQAAEDTAKDQLVKAPDYLTQYLCTDCNDRGTEPRCCYLKWRQHVGPKAICCTSEQALKSVLPTVDEIATAAAKVIVYCDHHGNIADERCNRYCKQNQRELRSPPIYGAEVLATSSSRYYGYAKKQEVARAGRPSNWNPYADHQCCGGGTQIDDIYGHLRKPCCYEMFQAGEGNNVEHIRKRKNAAIIASIAAPVYDKAKATIDAGLSPEETAKAVLGEYEKATARYADKQSAFHSWLQNKGVTIYKPKEVKAAAMFPKFVTTKAMFRLKKIYYKIRSRAEYMSSLTGPVTGPWRAICRDAEDISLWRKATLSFHDWKLNVLGVRSYVGAGLENEPYSVCL